MSILEDTASPSVLEQLITFMTLEGLEQLNTFKKKSGYLVHITIEPDPDYVEEEVKNEQ